MKHITEFILVLSTLAILQSACPTNAENAAANFPSMKEVVETLPRTTTQALKSTGTKLDKAMTEANEQMRTNVVDKHATVTVKVKVLDIQKSPGADRAFRLQVADMPLRIEGSPITVRMWVIFSEDAAQVVAGINKGREITVSGTLTRAMFTNFNSKLHLDVDLEKTTLK